MKRFLQFSGLITALTVMALVMFQGCVKNNIDLGQTMAGQWNPNLAAPLINTNLSIANIITKSGTQNVNIDKTNFCTLIYTGTLFSAEAKNLIQFPTQSFSTGPFSLTPVQITSLEGNDSITENYTQSISFQTGSNNPLIDTVIFNGGVISDSIISGFRQNMRIVVTIPAAKKAGIPFSQTIQVTYKSGMSTPIVSVSKTNLSGYLFDMTEGGTTTNTFMVNYAATFYFNSGNTIFPSDQITFYQNISSPMFDKIFGYVGQLNLLPNANLDTVALSIFKTTSTGINFSLINPKLTFLFYNSFGVPIGANLTTFEGYTPPSTNYAITGSGIPTPLPILSPSMTQIGQTLIDSFSLDNSNSNIQAIINNSPQNLIYQMSAKTNPKGKTANFVIDTSKVKVNLEVQLPLYGTLSNFTIQDTIKSLSLPLSGQPGYTIQSLLLRVVASNGFPSNMSLQVYFTDSLFHKLDSLPVPPATGLLINSGIVSGITGMVTSPTTQTSNFTFTSTNLANMSKAKAAIIKGVLSTYNNGKTPVKIYSTYQLSVQIGAQAQLSIALSPK